MEFLHFTLFMILLMAIPVTVTIVWKATTTTVLDHNIGSLRASTIVIGPESNKSDEVIQPSEYYLIKDQCFRTLMAPHPPPEQWRDKYIGNMSFSSQYGQDLWAYYGLFYRFYDYSITGYYVDLAAGMPRYISNTFFFDMCLNWFGLCIEGDPEKKGYFDKSSRTCEFAPVIIDEKENTRSFTSNANGLMNGLQPDWKLKSSTGKIIQVKTDTLSNVLNKTQIQNVDFFSLDLESYEAQALKTLNFTKYKVDVFLIERGDSKSPVYEIMMANNYTYLGGLGKSSNIDYVYIRNDSIWNRHCVWAQLSPPVPVCDFTFEIVLTRFDN